MSWISGILGGVAEGLGMWSQQRGQQQTNEANEAINNANIDAAWQRQGWAQSFSADQSKLARDWSAQQIGSQEQFQKETMQTAMDYDTNMSNTAMQRRMQDLREAGVNPLLAVSQGGASTPTISPMPGSITSAASASGSPAGQGSGIPMQNPNAQMGNLAANLNSGMQIATMGANIDLMRAQANKLNTEAGTEIPAQVGYLKSMTGLNDQNATQAYYNTMKIQEQIYGERLSNDQLRDIITPMGNQNLQVLQATRDALISAQQSDATAKALGLQKLRNMNEIESSNVGQILNWIDRILTPVGSAAGIASKFVP